MGRSPSTSSRTRSFPVLMFFGLPARTRNDGKGRRAKRCSGNSSASPSNTKFLLHQEVDIRHWLKVTTSGFQTFHDGARLLGCTGMRLVDGDAWMQLDEGFVLCRKQFACHVVGSVQRLFGWSAITGAATSAARAVPRMRRRFMEISRCNQSVCRTIENMAPINEASKGAPP